ncbi:MAG: hypothetical protein C4293_10085, partial [Nitrospiraceae bacterium]
MSEPDGNQGKKNLAAIREMLLSRQQIALPASSLARTGESFKLNSESWISPYGFFTPMIRQEKSGNSSFVQGIQIPRPGKHPPNDYQLSSYPLVPPYTFFAPIGSAYPGTIRC